MPANLHKSYGLQRHRQTNSTSNMKLSKLDQFTIVATVVGFVTDVSEVGGWIGISGVPLGSSEKPGLALAVTSFYSLTLVSFIARRLLYKYKINQSRIQPGKSRSKIAAKGVESHIPDRDVSITKKQKQDIETAEFAITCIAAGIVLWPPILTIDWTELQFDLTNYTYAYYPPLILLIVMFILIAVTASSLVARQLYTSIIGFN